MILTSVMVRILYWSVTFHYITNVIRITESGMPTIHQFYYLCGNPVSKFIKFIVFKVQYKSNI
jgi:hypothetical protein